MQAQKHDYECENENKARASARVRMRVQSLNNVELRTRDKVLSQERRSEVTTRF